jgi:lipid II:glycine glycyltransferase (peptidoglycan interpeptide bridge formation enzyme)
MLTVDTITEQATWNAALRDLPHAHVLQTWEWGEFKRATTGWQPQRIAFRRGAELVALASIGVRRIGPFRVMYAPRGPAMAYTDEALVADVLDALQQRARGAIWLKIDPDVIAASGVPGEPDDVPHPTGSALIERLKARGWRYSDDQVQFRGSITIDLTRGEDAILAAMSQNTRRKVRTATKKGVTVRAGSTADLDILYDLYRVTGARDGFLIRPPEYYRLAWGTFIDAGLAHPLIAEYEGQPIAHVILFRFGRTCWYFYGASADQHRDRMPNYLLQWEALRWAKEQGCVVYDMWGAPSTFTEDDPLWGVYQFKRGFRGTVIRTIGAWDYAPHPPLYAAYMQLWPRIRAAMRRSSSEE